MTRQEKIEIAKLVAWEVSQTHTCPHGIDADTAASLKEFAETWNSGKKTALITFVAGVVAGLGTLVTLGIVKKMELLFK
ncbi:MAG: hypothetical protein WC082_16300 [Victivallales bacterium]